MRTMLRQCLAVMRREVYYLWRDKGLRNILLAGSLLGLLVFYATYSTQVLKDIPTAVVDLDCSRESRQLVEDVSGAENLKVVACPGSFAEVEELIRRGQVVVGIVIPENYAKSVSLRRQVNLSVIIDGSNMIYATNAANTVLARVQSTLKQGLKPCWPGACTRPGRKPSARYLPGRTLFNPP